MEIEVRRLKRLVPAVMMLWGVVSCQTIEPSNGSEKPVVQGYLAANHSASVQVTTEVLFANGDTTELVNGLSIKVAVDEATHTLTQDVEGNYIDPTLIIGTGKKYSIQFQYGDKLITSETLVPPAPTGYAASANSMSITQITSGSGFPGFQNQPDPIVLTWDNADQSYYLVVVKNIETSPVPINTVITDRVFIFRSNPIQTNTYQISAREFQYYGKHWVILYKINPEYAYLYQNNGTSSLNIKTPYTNVSNGLGIFTGINADTIMVTINKP